MVKILIVHPDEYYQQQYAEIVREMGHEPVWVKVKEGESYATAALRAVNQIVIGDRECNAVLLYWDLGDKNLKVTGNVLARQLQDWKNNRHLLFSTSSVRVDSDFGILYDDHFPMQDVSAWEGRLGEALARISIGEDEREMARV